MSRDLIIVVLGTHQVIRQCVSLHVTPPSRFEYFYALAEQSLEANGHYGPDFNTAADLVLMDLEFKRNKQVAAVLNKGHVPVIEQWHIGNLSTIQARSPDLVARYRAQLQDYLSSLPSVIISALYVSCDFSQLDVKQAGYLTTTAVNSCATQSILAQSLANLSSLLLEYGISTQTIDGDAPIEVVQQRVDYLLKTIVDH